MLTSQTTRKIFLGGDQEREEAAAEEDTDDEGHVDMNKLRHQAGINKKTGKRANELKDAAKKAKRKERKKNAPHPLNFSALHLLHDPQGFAEKLFQQHLQPSQPKVRLNLEQKLLVLQLVSRLVGLHKLTLIPLYSYFLKFFGQLEPTKPQPRRCFFDEQLPRMKSESSVSSWPHSKMCAILNTFVGGINKSSIKSTLDGS